MSSDHSPTQPQETFQQGQIVQSPYVYVQPSQRIFYDQNGMIPNTVMQTANNAQDVMQQVAIDPDSLPGQSSQINRDQLGSLQSRHYITTPIISTPTINTNQIVYGGQFNHIQGIPQTAHLHASQTFPSNFMNPVQIIVANDHPAVFSNGNCIHSQSVIPNRHESSFIIQSQPQVSMQMPYAVNAQAFTPSQFAPRIRQWRIRPAVSTVRGRRFYSSPHYIAPKVSSMQTPVFQSTPTFYQQPILPKAVTYISDPSCVTNQTQSVLMSGSQEMLQPTFTTAHVSAMPMSVSTNTVTTSNLEPSPSNLHMNNLSSVGMNSTKESSVCNNVTFSSVTSEFSSPNFENISASIPGIVSIKESNTAPLTSSESLVENIPQVSSASFPSTDAIKESNDAVPTVSYVSVVGNAEQVTSAAFPDMVSIKQSNDKVPLTLPSESLVENVNQLSTASLFDGDSIKESNDTGPPTVSSISPVKDKKQVNTNATKGEMIHESLQTVSEQVSEKTESQQKGLIGISTQTEIKPQPSLIEKIPVSIGPLINSNPQPSLIKKVPIRKKVLQKAIVKPQVITHLIGGILIQEDTKPSTVKDCLLKSPQKLIPSSGILCKNDAASPSRQDVLPPSDVFSSEKDLPAPIEEELSPEKTDISNEPSSTNSIIEDFKKQCDSADKEKDPSVVTPEIELKIPKVPRGRGRPRKNPRKRQKVEPNIENNELSTEKNPESISRDNSSTNERNNETSENNETLSEKPLPYYRKKLITWTVQDVYDFVSETPFPNYADNFKNQEIDGNALMVLTAESMMKNLGVKCGPGLKILAMVENMLKEPNRY